MLWAALEGVWLQVEDGVPHAATQTVQAGALALRGGGEDVRCAWRTTVASAPVAQLPADDDLKCTRTCGSAASDARSNESDEPGADQRITPRHVRCGGDSPVASRWRTHAAALPEVLPATMPALSIPRRYRVGIAAVDSLTDADVSVLAEHLKTDAPEVSFKELAAQVSGEISAEVNLARVLEAVASLNTLLPEDGAGADTLAQDVSESEHLHLPEDKRPAYAARLEKLMRVPALVLAARATEVVREHDKVFHDARVLTDVRPVFERDPSTGARMAALVATLKLEYHPGGRGAIESAFVALDRDDLERLRGMLDRALTKMDSLSRLMKETDVPRWTETYHDHG